MGIIMILAIAWSVFSSAEDGGGKVTAEKRETNTKEDPCLLRGGSAKHTYNLFFQNNSGEGLLVRKVSFTGLDTAKAEVSVDLRYEGTRPLWAEKKSSFTVRQPTRSDAPQFKNIGPVKKISGENAFGQRLSGLFVNPEDVGIASIGSQPVYPLFLEIKGFVPKRSVSFGLLTPADCPVGSLSPKTEGGKVDKTKKKSQAKKKKSQAKKKKSQAKKKKSQAKKKKR
jgi:hypothetical protein